MTTAPTPSIEVIASGYDVICPLCELDFRIMAAGETTICPWCDRILAIKEAQHAYGGPVELPLPDPTRYGTFFNRLNPETQLTVLEAALHGLQNEGVLESLDLSNQQGDIAEIQEKLDRFLNDKEETK